MNAWIFILPALVFITVLFGRYTLRIRFFKTGPSFDARVNLQSVGDVVGLDWRSDGTGSSFRIVLFRKPWRISGKDEGTPEEENEAVAGKPDSSGRDRKRLAAGRVRALVRLGWKALERLGRVFHLEQADLKLSFGTGDPCTTGILFGLAQILLSVPGKRFETDVVPDFVHRRLEGEADVTLRFTMAHLVAVGIMVFIRAAMVLKQS